MANRSPERERFLADIIITAVEGGTGYWASVSAYDHPEDSPAETRAILHEEDGERYSEVPLEVTLDVVALGIARIKQDGFSIRSELKNDIIVASEKNDDEGLLDAEAADVIVQAGLFGQIVYG